MGRKKQRERRRQKHFEESKKRLSGNEVSITALLAKYKAHKKTNALEVSDPEIKNWTGKFNDLNRQFWDNVVQNGYIPSLKDVEEMDTIDVREVVREGERRKDKYLHTLSPKEMAFSQGSIYHIVPPFSEGCVRVQSHRYYFF